MAAAPVREDNPAIEKRDESILSRRPERGGRRQFTHREGARPLNQHARDARLAAIGETDLQPIDGLLADAILFPEPGEYFGIPDEPLVVEFRERGQSFTDSKRDLVSFFRLLGVSRRELRERRQTGARGQEVPSLAVGFRHAAGLAARCDAVADELDQLQDVAADPAGVAIPALLVEPDVERSVRLAAVVRAIAEQSLPGFLGDAARQQLAGNLANIDIGDLAIIGVYIHHRGDHRRTSGGSPREFGSLIA